MGWGALGTAHSLSAWASSFPSLLRPILRLYFADSPGAPEALGRTRPPSSPQPSGGRRVPARGSRHRERARLPLPPQRSSHSPSRPSPARALRGGCTPVQGEGRRCVPRGGSRGGGRSGAPGSPRGGPTSPQAEGERGRAVPGQSRRAGAEPPRRPALPVRRASESRRPPPQPAKVSGTGRE